MKNKLIFQVMISGAGGKGYRNKKTPIPGPANLVLSPDRLPWQGAASGQESPAACPATWWDLGWKVVKVRLLTESRGDSELVQGPTSFKELETYTKWAH